ncbi:hypothetical protein MC885_000032, partial [Smutsia gigantea]
MRTAGWTRVSMSCMSGCWQWTAVRSSHSTMWPPRPLGGGAQAAGSRYPTCSASMARVCALSTSCTRLRTGWSPEDCGGQ